MDSVNAIGRFFSRTRRRASTAKQDRGLDDATRSVLGDFIKQRRGVEGWVVPLAGWPATAMAANAVRVRWVAGLGCPPGIRGAILAWLAYREQNRASIEMPPGVAAALAPFRRTGL